MLKFVLVLGIYSKHLNQTLVYPYIQRAQFPSSAT